MTTRKPRAAGAVKHTFTFSVVERTGKRSQKAVLADARWALRKMLVLDQGAVEHAWEKANPIYTKLAVTPARRKP